MKKKIGSLVRVKNFLLAEEKEYLWRNIYSWNSIETMTWMSQQLETGVLVIDYDEIFKMFRIMFSNGMTEDVLASIFETIQ